MSLPGSTPIFSLGDHRFDWSDVKVAAAVWGDWQDVERRARQGLAALRFLEADEREIEAERLEAASDDFRERRNLISAEEMTAGLDERGLDADEWIAVIERSLARERCAAEMDEIVATYPVEKEEIDAIAECESFCSGGADSAAWKLAAVAAFAAAKGALEAPATENDAERESRNGRLAALIEELCAGAVTPDAVERMVELHRLDWTTVDCRLAAFGDEDAAREAALCVLEEGEDLAAIAESAGSRLDRSRFVLEDLPAELRQRLLSAEKGKLVGPIVLADRPTLLIVDDKRAPDAGETTVRERAERRLVDAAIEHHARSVRFELSTGR